MPHVLAFPLAATRKSVGTIRVRIDISPALRAGGPVLPTRAHVSRVERPVAGADGPLEIARTGSAPPGPFRFGGRRVRRVGLEGKSWAARRGAADRRSGRAWRRLPDGAGSRVALS